MADYWIPAVAGAIGVFLFLLLLVLIFIRRERQLFRTRVVIWACISLFEAAKELGETEADEQRVLAAKRRIADAVDRLNQSMGQDIIPYAGELFSLMERFSASTDRAEMRMILDAVLSAVCKSLDPLTARELQNALTGLRH